MCWFKKENKPEIEKCGTININLASSILLDKAEELGQTSVQIFLPDANFKIYRKSDVANSYALAEVSAIKYETEVHDCDDFAAELFGKFAGLVWTDVHALNWFIDENNTFWFIEPQNKKMAKMLDDWQGHKIRFFIGR